MNGTERKTDWDSLLLKSEELVRQVRHWATIELCDWSHHEEDEARTEEKEAKTEEDGALMIRMSMM